MSEWAQTPEAILRRLEWTVLRRLDGLLYGDYRTLFRGFGGQLAPVTNAFSERDGKGTEVSAQIAGKLWPVLPRRAIGGSGVDNHEWQRHYLCLL